MLLPLFVYDFLIKIFFTVSFGSFSLATIFLKANFKIPSSKWQTSGSSSRFLAQREKKHLYHIKELKQSAFTRTIQLPDDLDLEPEVCHLEDGILKLAFKKIIAKKEEPTETVKKISIKKS